MSYTPEQEKAVTSPKCNLLVTAAAGAGKTHVLTGRIIRRITDSENPVDVDRLLVATFTKAAASEMRERIDQALSKELEAHPESQRLAEQISRLPNATISTIDAFCQKIVREYFYRVGVDPSFRMLDPRDAEILRYDALSLTMEELYAEENPDFSALVQSYSNARSDGPIEGMILSLSNELESAPFPGRKRKEIRERYENVDESLFKSINGDIKRETAEIKDAARMAIQTSMPEAYIAWFQNVCDWAQEAMDMTDEDRKEFLSEIDLPQKPRVNGAEESAKRAFDQFRNTIRNSLKRIGEWSTFSPEEEVARRAELLPVVRGLLTGVERMEAILTEMKGRRNAWSFADVERMCLGLFNGAEEDEEPFPSEIAREVAKRYDEIYVDEYQDSNDIQEWIFRLISGEWENAPNLFMVGDLKQSIYRFRNSNPLIFREKKEQYNDSMDGLCRKIELTYNFRSRQEVVDGVNTVFRPLMKVETGDVDYQSGEELVFGAEYYPPSAGDQNRCELLLAEVCGEEGIDQELSGDEEEAVMIARRIQSLMREGFCVFDKERQVSRPVQYKDIAVLMRGGVDKGRKIEEYMAVFDAFGIPVYAHQEGGYYDALEIRTFLSLLEIVDNPRQDIPLVSVLRSPMGGITEAELANIRFEHKGENFYDALCHTAEEESPLGQKLCTFLERLKEWRERARYVGVDVLVAYLLEDTGWYAFVGALPGGDLRQKNLRALHRRSAVHESQIGGGLFPFLLGIWKSKEQKQDLEAARRIEGDMNVVQVMTIHHSKGLEFPVVFVASLGNKMNRAETSGNMIYHREMGLGMQYIHPTRRIRYGNALRTAVARQIECDMISEEMRVLYVAMTRAREKLILTAKVANAAEKTENWKEAKPASVKEIRGAKCFLDWIAPVILQDEAHTYGVQVFHTGTLTLTEEEQGPTLEREESICDKQAVREKLSYQYPFAPLAKIPPLLTVTELKGMQTRAEEDESAPLYTPELPELSLEEDAALTPAQKGTINHFVMQHLDVSDRDVEAQIRAMVENELLTEEEAAAADVPAICAFMETPLAERMRRATVIHRESPFMMRLPCREVPGMEEGKDAMLVVQGIVDCWFEEADKIVIVDYKTDRTGDIKTIKKRYQIQMDLYKKALSLKKFKKSSEKFIYLFYNRSVIPL